MSIAFERGPMTLVKKLAEQKVLNSPKSKQLLGLGGFLRWFAFWIHLSVRCYSEAPELHVQAQIPRRAKEKKQSTGTESPSSIALNLPGLRSVFLVYFRCKTFLNIVIFAYFCHKLAAQDGWGLGAGDVGGEFWGYFSRGVHGSTREAHDK